MTHLRAADSVGPNRGQDLCNVYVSELAHRV